MSSDTYATHRIRSSVKAFAIGKALTAPASFFLVFLLASVMPAQQYAAYVAAAASLEIGIAVGSFGLDWLAQRVVPGVRVQGTAIQFRRAVALLAILQTIPYTILGSAIILWAGAVARLLSDVVSVDVLRIYGAVLVIEGIARMLRDQILGALMLQRVVQVLQSCRMVVLLSATLAMHFGGVDVTAHRMALTELTASLITLAGAAISLARYVIKHPGRDGDATSLSPWISRQSVRFAANAYGSFLLTLSLGPEVVTALVARMLGVEATAQFGFAARVVEQVRKFLPMDLLWVVIRPALIGRFESSGRDFGRLTGDVAVILRANLLLLGAVMVLFLGAGDAAAHLSTRGNLNLPPLFLGILLVQVLGHSLRRSLELTAFTIGRSHLFLVGSFASLAVPVLLMLFLSVYPSLYPVPLAMLAAETLFSFIVFHGLRRDGHAVRVLWRRWLWLILIVGVSALVTGLAAAVWHGLFGLIAAAAVGMVVYACLLLGLKVLSMADVQALLGLVRSRLHKTPTSQADVAERPVGAGREPVQREVQDPATIERSAAQERPINDLG